MTQAPTLAKTPQPRSKYVAPTLPTPAGTLRNAIRQECAAYRSRHDVITSHGVSAQSVESSLHDLKIIADTDPISPMDIAAVVEKLPDFSDDLLVSAKRFIVRANLTLATDAAENPTPQTSPSAPPSDPPSEPPTVATAASPEPENKPQAEGKATAKFWTWVEVPESDINLRTLALYDSESHLRANCWVNSETKVTWHIYKANGVGGENDIDGGIDDAKRSVSEALARAGFTVELCPAVTHPTLDTPVGTRLRSIGTVPVVECAVTGHRTEGDTDTGESDRYLITDAVFEGAPGEITEDYLEEWEVVAEPTPATDKGMALAPKSATVPAWKYTRAEFEVRASEFPGLTINHHVNEIERAIEAGESVEYRVVASVIDDLIPDTLKRYAAIQQSQIALRDKQVDVAKGLYEDLQHEVSGWMHAKEEEDSLREQTADATKERKGYEKRLRERAADGFPSLFAQALASGETATPAASAANTATNEAPAENDAWKSVSIDALDMTDSLKELLRNAKKKNGRPLVTPLTTLGAVAAYCNDHFRDGGLCDLQGIGVETAEKITTALTAWFAKNPDKFPPIHGDASNGGGVPGAATGLGDAVQAAAQPPAEADPTSDDDAPGDDTLYPDNDGEPTNPTFVPDESDIPA